MGGARKSEAKLAPRDRRSPGGDGPVTYGPTYTPSDAAHFERLADLSHVSAGIGAGADRRAGERPAAPSSSAFEYTESDARAFDRLMGQLGSGRVRVRPAKRGASAGSGYTESDNRLFDELLSADRFSTAAAQDGPGRTEVPAESTVRYTRQDLDAFEKFMPGGSAGDGRRSEERSGGPARPDRDVGHIRIVDSDQEQARGKESRRPGKVNIKVRYFD